jgi:hypothetical protein
MTALSFLKRCSVLVGVLAVLPSASFAATRGLFRTDTALWYQNDRGEIVTQIEDNVQRSYADLKKQAQTIATKDLVQIPIGLFTDHRPIKDTDRDGIDDEYERAYGTNPKVKDSDKDGYDDRTEILAGYHPLKKSVSMALNRSLFERLKGRFVWDAKWKELWFIPQLPEKRYFISTQKALSRADLLAVANMYESSSYAEAPVNPAPVTVTPVVSPAPQAPSQPAFTPITSELVVRPGFCGNGLRNEGESCDGEWYCDASCGLSRLTRFEPSESPLRSCLPSNQVDGLFEMKVGSACTYPVNGKIYTIRLSSQARYPEFVVTDGVTTYETGYLHANIYPVGNDFALSRYRFQMDVVGGIYTVSIHKMIPTDQIVVRANCDDLQGEERIRERCRQFVQNQKTIVLPALDQLSGYSMGRCYKEIQIRIDPASATSPLGYAHQDGGLGIIPFQSRGISAFLNQEPPVDEHEMLHLLNICLNVPNTEEANHTFFGPRQSEMYRLMGNASMADQYLGYIRMNSAYDPADPATPAALTGCAGVKTQLLSRRFLEDPGIIYQYYADIVQNIRMLAKDGEATQTNNMLYNRIVARLLGSTQTVIDQINSVCPYSRI